MAHDNSLQPEDSVLFSDSLDDTLLYQIGSIGGEVPGDYDDGEAGAAETEQADSGLSGQGDESFVASLGYDGTVTSVSVNGPDLGFIQSASSLSFAPVSGSAMSEPANTGADSVTVRVTADYGGPMAGWTGPSGGACNCPMCAGGGAAGAAPSGPAVGAPAPATTLATLATYLSEYNTGSSGSDFWDDFWGGGSEVSNPHWNLTAAGTNAKGGVITFNIANANSFDGNGLAGAAQQEAIRNALDTYEDILGINFVETTDANADLVFGDWDIGRAYANFNRSADGSIINAWINIGAGWGGSGVGDYYYQTALHEIGHTLGLGHQGNYNAGQGSLTYANQAQWQNDTIAYTMMSYWAQGNYTQPGYSTPSGALLGSVDLIGPQIVDWLALDRMYSGQGYGIANGITTSNTTWGFNGSWFNTAVPPNESYGNDAYSSMSTLLSTTGMCIVDGGGIDTLDLSGFSNNSLIDLRLNSASSTTVYFMNVAGLIGNLSTAVGTVIENAVGGAGSEVIYGNSAANILTGNGGNDTIIADGSSDNLDGGDGNDLFQVTSGGSTTITGGLGIDTVDFLTYGYSGILSVNERVIDVDLGYSFQGGAFQGTWSGIENFVSWANVAVTLIGNASANLLQASSQNDSLDGEIGNDTLLGLAGNDTLIGGDGDDSLSGGDGDDELRGDGGLDTLRGDNGNDRLWPNSSLSAGEIYDGGAGNDTLDFSNFGLSYSVDLAAGTFSVGATSTTLISIEAVNAGSGNDTIQTTPFGGEQVWGNGGDDVIGGGLNSQTLYGGVGNDSIYGDGIIAQGSGVGDLLDGGDGDDHIEGAGGSDTIIGGNGNDFVIGDRGSFSSGDSMDGGAGTDTVSYANSFAAVTVLLNSASNTGGTAQGDTLSGFEVVIGSAWADSLDGNSYNATLQGGAGNDTLVGGYGSQSLDGGDGDDYIYVRDGEYLDSVSGGAGIDTLDHSAESALWVNGAVFDFLTGVGTSSFSATGTISLSGIEIYYDGAGSNTIIADAAGGSWYGGLGDDTVSGQAGNDVVSGGDGNDLLSSGGGNDTIDGGAGNDTVDFSYSLSDWVVALAAGTAQIAGTTYALLTSIENVIGGGGADWLVGDAGNNLLDGNVGNDSLNGANGSDTLIGGGGNDTLNGGAGDDSMSGGAGDDYIVVSSLGDTVYGGTGNDTIQTGLGSYSIAAIGSVENLVGGAGSQSLTGNAQANVIDGQDGNDKLYGGGAGDTLLGGIGNDTLDGGTGADSMDGGDGNDRFFVDSAGDTVVGGAGTDTVQTNLAFYSIFGIADVENLTGGAAAQTLNGNNGNNVINGQGGDDSIGGYGGDDSLIGGAGADTLDGGIGNDTLNGGAGNDSMNGGGGDDLFYVNSGGDTVIGGAGIDTISTGLAFYSIWTKTDIENLTGGAAAQTLNGNNNNNFIDGGSGNDNIGGFGGDDTLAGGAGNDTLDGGVGADDFLFAHKGGVNADTIVNFISGSDEIGLNILAFGAAGPVGTLAASAFRLGAAAVDADDRIIFDAAGRLWYDADGVGGAAQVLVANLGAASLAASDVFIF